MIDLLPFLKSLSAAPGLSGYETPVRRLIEEAWRPRVDELSISRLGSLHGLKRGSAPLPRHSMLIAAHMDAIGLMVAGITEGFLRVTEIGGVDARILPGQLVTVHGRQDLPGVIVQPPDYLLPPEAGERGVKLADLLVDVGLLTSQVSSLVRVGDVISFAQEPFEAGADILAGPSLDNRASIAALTYCLDEIQGRQLEWDVWVVATSQEEETLGGASTSTFQLRPDLAVVVDVTFASSPDTPGHKAFPLGKGVTLGYGPNVHPALHAAFKELAERLEIPYKVEVMPRHSGTDAFSMQVVAEGFPTMVIGIPLRYMHTPVEMVSMKDIQRAGRLLAEFAAALGTEFVEKLVWSD